MERLLSRKNLLYFPWKSGDGNHEYICSLSLIRDPRAISIFLMDKITGEEYTGNYRVNYIEKLTKKTGNFKDFDTFLTMLRGGLMKTSANARVELSTRADLEEIRSRRHAENIVAEAQFDGSYSSLRATSSREIGSDRSGTSRRETTSSRTSNLFPPSAEDLGSARLDGREFSQRTFNLFPLSTVELGSKADTEKFLVVTYSSEFDKITYVLPLEYFSPPNPMKMAAEIKKLKSQLSELRTSNFAIDSRMKVKEGRAQEDLRSGSFIQDFGNTFPPSSSEPSSSLPHEVPSYLQLEEENFYNRRNFVEALKVIETLEEKIVNIERRHIAENDKLVREIEHLLDLLEKLNEENSLLHAQKLESSKQSIERQKGRKETTTIKSRTKTSDSCTTIKPQTPKPKMPFHKPEENHICSRGHVGTEHLIQEYLTRRKDKETKKLATTGVTKWRKRRSKSKSSSSSGSRKKKSPSHKVGSGLKHRRHVHKSSSPASTTRSNCSRHSCGRTTSVSPTHARGRSCLRSHHDKVTSDTSSKYSTCKKKLTFDKTVLNRDVKRGTDKIRKSRLDDHRLKTPNVKDKSNRKSSLSPGLSNTSHSHGSTNTKKTIANEVNPHEKVAVKHRNITKQAIPIRNDKSPKTRKRSKSPSKKSNPKLPVENVYMDKTFSNEDANFSGTPSETFINILHRELTKQASKNESRVALHGSSSDTSYTEDSELQSRRHGKDPPRRSAGRGRRPLSSDSDD